MDSSRATSASNLDYSNEREEGKEEEYDYFLDQH